MVYRIHEIYIYSIERLLTFRLLLSYTGRRNPRLCSIIQEFARQGLLSRDRPSSYCFREVCYTIAGYAGVPGCGFSRWEVLGYGGEEQSLEYFFRLVFHGYSAFTGWKRRSMYYDPDVNVQILPLRNPLVFPNLNWKMLCTPLKLCTTENAIIRNTLTTDIYLFM